MAKPKVFENPEYAKFPATASGARELGLQYYYTGKICKNGHRSLRYTTSSNCIMCMAEKQGRLQISRNNARSEANYKRAEKALDAGLSTYVPETPCRHGHSLRYVGSGNCVECAKQSVAKKAAQGYQRWRRIEKEYGLTREEYEELRNKQDSKCAICSNTFISDTKTHVDHCHSTGKVRGLLCGPCNQALGLFKEDLTLLEKASLYLAKHLSS